MSGTNTKKAASANGAEAVEKPESQIKAIWDALKANRAAVVGLVIVIILMLIAIIVGATQLVGLQILPYDPNEAQMADTFQTPSAQHWFGTDQLGRDIFSRVMDGTKISLFTGMAIVAVSLAAGIVLGSLAGYYGGWVDTIIMRIMDIMMAIPSILLAIALMAALGKGLDKTIFAIGLVSIPEYARIIRGSILSVKENDYVQAARVVGNRDRRIIFRHVLPNVISPIIVRATLGISTAILDISALGFLGLGVQPPYAEWGDMLGRARGYIFSAPYTLVFPGIAITLTVFAFNMLGDGLSDALNPKSRTK